MGAGIALATEMLGALRMLRPVPVAVSWIVATAGLAFFAYRQGAIPALRLASWRLWRRRASPVLLLEVASLALVAFVVLIALAIGWMARPSHPQRPDEPSLPAGAAPHRDDGIYRVLVIADDDCTPADLGAAIAEHGESARMQALVIAPAMGSRTARWTGDERAYRDAAQHLEATLGALGELGVVADGHVGSHDPLQAADDGLREFPADEIVFAVHPADQENWLEKGVVDDARERYPIPVRSLAVLGREESASTT